MRRLRLIVPVAVIAAVLMMLIAPAGALAAPSEGHHKPGCTQWYTVRCGDTLGDIAWRYGTTASYLASINGIRNPNKIYPGQTICVAKGGGGHCQGGFTYVVKRGDTLGDIAWRFGVNSSYLARVNGLCNPNKIYAGQRLWIPGGC